MVANENNELIPTRFTSGWRVCIDYRKLNAGTKERSLSSTDSCHGRVIRNQQYLYP